MGADPAAFLRFYYEVVIFEYWGVCHGNNSIPFHMIAKAFQAAWDVYKDFPHRLSCPCDRFIFTQDLISGKGVRNFIEGIQLKILPSNLVKDRESIYDSDVSDGPFLVETTTRLDHYGYKVTPKGVILPNQGYNSIEFRLKFAYNYAKFVPMEYQDDISVLILEVRSRLRGYFSPTILYSVHGSVHGIAQYTREGSEMKLKGILPGALDLTPEQERILKQLDEAKARREKAAKSQRMQSSLRHATTLTTHSIIEDYITKLQNSTIITEVRKSEIESLRRVIQAVIDRWVGRQIFEVLLYGSHASGLGNCNSDVDFVVMSRSDTDLRVHNLEELLIGAGYKINMVLPTARVPIVTFFDWKTTLTCDICVDQPLGVENSKLINIYRQMDDRFMPLWVAVRHLAKRHNILDGRKHYLSSYALALMLISYLQMCNILPKLQDQTEKKLTTKMVGGWDCAFDTDWEKRKRGHSKDITVAVLLLRVCRYFGFVFDFATMDLNPRKGICQTRSVKYIKNSQDQQKLLNAPICIMDPFMRDRNVACNVSSNTVERIRMAFQHAIIGVVPKSVLSGEGRNPHPDIHFFIYEVFVYELTSIFGPGKFIPHYLLASCFDLAARFSMRENSALKYDYHTGIYIFGFNEESNVYYNFLYDEEPNILPATPSQDPTSTDSYFGYRVTQTGITLPTWSEPQRIEFLRGYNTYVPIEYRDDISAIAYEMRTRFSGCRPNDHRILVHSTLPAIPMFSGQEGDVPLEQAMQQLQVSKSSRKKKSYKKKKLLYNTLSDSMTELWTTTAASPTRIREVEQLKSRVEADIESFYSGPRVKAYSGSQVKLYMHGSQSNGLSDLQSQVDLVIVYFKKNQIVDDDDETFLDIETFLTEYKYRIQSVLLRTTSSPIVTFYDPKTKLTANICGMNSYLAVYRANLIDTYRQIDARFTVLWFTIRHVAKKHGILDRSKQMLSSYALQLMLITFLQRTTPPVLPLLQKLPSEVMNFEECSGVFDTDWSKYSTFGSANKFSAGELLEQFFHFYGWVVQFDEHEIDARLGWIGVKKMERFGWVDPHLMEDHLRQPICIMDPFEHFRNVARHIDSWEKVKLIQTTFQKIYQEIEGNPAKAVEMIS